MSWTEIEHADSGALAHALAARLSTLLDAAMHERGEACLALAGGRTAPPVMRQLAARPRDWRHVTVLPTDERWVSADHPDCNLRQLRAALTPAHDARWVALVPAQPSGEVDATFANAGLASIASTFDATLLGMGSDGHFASLFAGTPGLAAALDLSAPDAAVALVPDPLPSAGPHPRISLTLARLLRSRHVMLAIAGEEKRALLERAKRGYAATHLPVAALLHAPATTVEIHWSP